jgi:hypothetical protein
MPRFVALAAAILLLAACPADAPDPPADEPLTVEEALAADPDAPLVVRGFLFVAEDELPELCDLVLESYPPQRGGASVEVEGLDLGAYPLEEDAESGLRWSDGAVDVDGRLSDGLLIADG